MWVDYFSETTPEKISCLENGANRGIKVNLHLQKDQNNKFGKHVCQNTIAMATSSSGHNSLS